MSFEAAIQHPKSVAMTTVDFFFLKENGGKRESVIFLGEVCEACLIDVANFPCSKVSQAGKAKEAGQWLTFPLCTVTSVRHGKDFSKILNPIEIRPEPPGTSHKITFPPSPQEDLLTTTVRSPICGGGKWKLREVSDNHVLKSCCVLHC